MVPAARADRQERLHREQSSQPYARLCDPSLRRQGFRRRRHAARQERARPPGRRRIRTDRLPLPGRQIAAGTGTQHGGRSEERRLQHPLHRRLWRRRPILHDSSERWPMGEAVGRFGFLRTDCGQGKADGAGDDRQRRRVGPGD